MAVRIFSEEVAYKDVYTWDLHLKHADPRAALSGSGVGSPLVLEKNQVWHQLELTNTTPYPWTTGAAFIMEGMQPVAQELLTYTSPKDVTRLPVTASVDARGTFESKETARADRALKWSGYHHAKLSQQTTLGLCNHKSVPIEAEITCRFGGKAIKASLGGKINLSSFNRTDLVL